MNTAGVPANVQVSTASNGLGAPTRRSKLPSPFRRVDYSSSFTAQIQSQNSRARASTGLRKAGDTARDSAVGLERPPSLSEFLPGTQTLLLVPREPSPTNNRKSPSWKKNSPREPSPTNNRKLPSTNRNSPVDEQRSRASEYSQREKNEGTRVTEEVPHATINVEESDLGSHEFVPLSSNEYATIEYALDAVTQYNSVIEAAAQSNSGAGNEHTSRRHGVENPDHSNAEAAIGDEVSNLSNHPPLPPGSSPLPQSSTWQSGPPPSL